MLKASRSHYKYIKYCNTNILPNVTGTKLVIIFAIVFFLCVCVHVLRCTSIHVCGSQRSMLGTFLSHFPTLFLRQALSLNLELGNAARLAIKAQGASHLWLPSAGSTKECHYAWLCTGLQGNLNLGPPAFLRTLLNYHLSPYIFFFFWHQKALHENLDLKSAWRSSEALGETGRLSSGLNSVLTL